MKNQLIYHIESADFSSHQNISNQKVTEMVNHLLMALVNQCTTGKQPHIFLMEISGLKRIPVCEIPRISQ